MKRYSGKLAACPLLFALVCGCAGEEFDPFNRLTSLRVLAIKSEPVTPGPGEATTLSSLLYVPEDQSEPELAWSWCPFPGSPDEGYPCETDEHSLGELGEVLQLPPLELGTGATATLENTLDPEIASLFCQGEADASALPYCDEGFPVQVKLRVKTDQDEVVAVRKLVLRIDHVRLIRSHCFFEFSFLITKVATLDFDHINLPIRIVYVVRNLRSEAIPNCNRRM